MVNQKKLLHLTRSSTPRGHVTSRRAGKVVSSKNWLKGCSNGSGLSQESGVVRLYRTFSSYSVTGETRRAGCLSKNSGWFKHIEPHRTYTNHNITEIARCGEVCHMSSGWFDCTEPALAGCELCAVQGDEVRCA